MVGAFFESWIARQAWESLHGRSQKMSTMKVNREQKALRLWILEFSHRHHLSHLGSCLSAVDILAAVYKVKKKRERFVLSCGHAGIALFAVLVRCGLLKAADAERLHIHPDRDPGKGIDVSTGSLGQGLPIAVGMALADRRKNVYCLISDGECAEGSIWEALRVAVDQKLSNLKIIVNANGWGAYDPVSLSLLLKRLRGFGCCLKKVEGHDPEKLCRAFKSSSGCQPLVIFADTMLSRSRSLRDRMPTIM